MNSKVAISLKISVISASIWKFLFPLSRKCHEFFKAHLETYDILIVLCYKVYSPNIDTVRLWFLHVISSQDTQSVIFQIVVFHRNLHFNIVVPLTGSCAVVLYCDFTTTEL